MDVILITLDTVRADHLGCYGRSPSNTPNLDRLCAEGIRFDNAATSTPVTLPAHASMMTGLLPNHHGVRYNGEFRLGTGMPVLAGELKASGYDTAAFVSTFVLERRFGLARGFDVYDDHVDSSRQVRGLISRNERDAESVTDAALAYLAGRTGDKPLFLWVHYFDAHAPYAPREEPAEPGNEPAYAAEIGDVDSALGRLLASKGLDLSRTIVVVVADHGESLGEHEERTHGLFLYEATTHVPLIVRLPGGQGAGIREQGLVAHIDLRPSLLGLLGLKASGPADGIDWFATRRGPADGIYQEASLAYFDFGFAPIYGLRRETEKYVEAPAPELYDLATDPREQINLLAGGNLDGVGQQRQQLDALMLDAPDIVEAASHSRRADSDTLSRLRSLGYLGDAAPATGADLADPKSRIQAINLHQDAAAVLDAGRPDQALQLLRAADRMAPHNLSILRLMSKTQLRLGQIDAAEKTLLELLSIRKNPDSLVLLAQILILRNDFPAAEGLLDEAEQLEPESGGIPIARGDIARRRGDMAAAERWYGRAIKLDGDRVGAIARGRMQEMQKIRDSGE